MSPVVLHLLDEGLRPYRPPMNDNLRGPPIGDIFLPFAERLAELERQESMTERTRTNVLRALDLIDPAERAAFLERHRDEDPARLRWLKYADFVYWTHRNVLHAERLELDSSPPLDVWDIGTGSGSFPMVAKSMGHRVIGTDIPKPWGAELCRIAGVPRVNAAVKRGEPYQPVPGRFDLISIMMPNFQRTVTDQGAKYWSVDDWRFLLSGLAERSLKQDGRVFVLIPAELSEGVAAPSPLIDWAAHVGADVAPRPNAPHAAEMIFGRHHLAPRP